MGSLPVAATWKEQLTSLMITSSMAEGSNSWRTRVVGLAPRSPGLDPVQGLVLAPSPAQDPSLDLAPNPGIRIQKRKDRDPDLAPSLAIRMTRSEDQDLDLAPSPDPAPRMEREVGRDRDLDPSLAPDPGLKMEESLLRR